MSSAGMTTQDRMSPQYQKLRLQLKLQSYEVMNNQSRSSKSMRTFLKDDASSGSNCFRTMIFLPEYSFQKSSPKIQFSLLKIRFSSMAFRFLRSPRKSSSTAFRFLHRLSNFQETSFNGFLISSTAFCQQIIPIWNNLFR